MYFQQTNTVRLQSFTAASKPLLQQVLTRITLIMINNLSVSCYPVTMKCACCGGHMLPEKDIGNSIIYKCAECGLSDTRLKEVGQKRTDVSSNNFYHEQS